jgi:hypothetical protein
VRELVIVAADLYFAMERAKHEAGLAFPGLTRLGRFGRGEALPQGWRAWIAARMNRGDLARAPVAAIAVAGVMPPDAAAAADRSTVGAQVWLAAPVHLTVGLCSVHLDPRGVLRLDAAAQARLVESFDAHFGERGHVLVPASGGGFLIGGPPIQGVTRTTDPARCLGGSIAEAQPLGPGGGQLQRLSAEIEMWLHAHPLNAERERVGEPRVSALWLWGGASAAEWLAPNAPEMDPPQVGFFGDDPYVTGLASLTRSPCLPAPAALAEGVALPLGMTVIVVEVFRERARRAAPPVAPLEAFDRDFVVPALSALQRRETDSLTLVANDHAVALRRPDRLRLWRRPRHALEAFQ